MAEISNTDLISEAASVLRPRKLANDNAAGTVAAALITAQGHIFRGVCIDTSSGMGFCAEHAAVAAMITAGESVIEKVVAIGRNEKGSYVLPPCGRCREFMRQVDDANLEAEVVLGDDKVARLRELLPYHD